MFGKVVELHKVVAVSSNTKLAADVASFSLKRDRETRVYSYP